MRVRVPNFAESKLPVKTLSFGLNEYRIWWVGGDTSGAVCGRPRIPFDSIWSSSPTLHIVWAVPALGRGVQRGGGVGEDIQVY